MTTKYKIISGFVCMMLIIAVISVLGYRTLDSSVSDYGDYRRYARLNVRSSDALAALNTSVLSMNLFLAGYNEANAKAAQDSMDEVDSILADALKDMTSPKRIEIVGDLRKRGREYKEKSIAITAACRRMMEVFRTEVITNRGIVEKTTLDMTEAAQKNANADMLALLSRTGIEGAAVRFFMAQLINTRAEGHAVAITANMTTLMATVEKMKDFVQPAGMEAYGKLAAAYKAWQTGVGRMIEAAKAANAAIDDARVLRADMVKAFDALSKDFDQLMNTYGPAAMEKMLSGQHVLLSGSVVGMLAGLGLALIIVMGLMRVLSSLASYAHAVAGGDFSRQANVREKGEIGEVLSALQGIPAILGKLLEEANDAAERIMIGQFRFRPDASAFPGSYQELIESINTVSDIYTKTIDQLPIAIFAADTSYRMTYINDLTRTVLGGDKTGQTCAGCFKTPLCNTDKCFANRSMQNGKQAAGEVAIFPETGMNLELSVTAVPLRDKSGSMRGYMEVCADITEIKTKQRAMLNVAEKAKAISDRVASSSQELSAQVEQVSQGAQQQRDRVESTATAMTQMNSSVLEVARNAGQASEQSEATKHKAGDGAALVDKVVASINMVNTVAATLQTNMTELGGQAESIGGVMNVISDIADQTNLLALNAAIEAARAGEAGRGFAVVADEVRKLAEKTMNATHEVGASIKAIQQSAQTNISEVGNAVKAITEATELANTSGKALNEIVGLASANSSVVASIAAAAEEQSATSEEINRAIEEVSRIVAETSQGMHQSAAAVHDLSQMAYELNSVMSELK